MAYNTYACQEVNMHYKSFEAPLRIFKTGPVIITISLVHDFSEEK